MLKGEYVPLYKLLPGFEARTQELSQVVSDEGTFRLCVGDGSKERILSKQTLDLSQLLLALLKFKDIVRDSFPKKCEEIDMYIANVITIANKYQGLAYWYYHIYFWDKATEFSHRGEDLNWSVLDAEALHAAIANKSSANFCEH